MSKRSKRFLLERLEDRQMMAADVSIFGAAGLTVNDAFAQLQVVDGATVAREAYRPAAAAGFLGGGAAFMFPDVTGDLPTENQQLTEAELDIDMGLPLLDSKPGAAHTLYLDFNGHIEGAWWNPRGNYSNVVTPIFDTDYDPSRFGADDQEIIRDIWKAVAEDFAPFDINVTTHFYGEINDGQGLRVAIGGSSADWYVDPAQQGRPTGTSNSGSFDDPTKSNVVYVFEDEFSNLFIERLKLATTISHEAGHGFGLLHHVVFGANGEIVSEYNPGTSTWTPIMGDNLSTDRTTWGLGFAEDGLQDDMAFLSWKLGTRADDHGNRWSTASALSAPLTAHGAMTGRGIIESTADDDAFRFNAAGQIDVSVAGLKWVGNLMPVVELWSSQGLMATAIPTRGYADTGNLMSAKLTANVAAGEYMVIVRSVGDYGDVGQYTVTVSPERVLTTGNGSGITPATAPTKTGKLSVDARYADVPDSGIEIERDAWTPKQAFTDISPVVTLQPTVKRGATVTMAVDSFDDAALDAAFAMLGAV